MDLRPIAHPLRLPILVLLETEELSAAQLADRLDAPLGSVSHAVRDLARAGLIERVRIEPAGRGESTVRRVYRAKRKGWRVVHECLAELMP